MTRADYLGAVNDMHLSTRSMGHAHYLAVSRRASTIKDGDEVLWPTSPARYAVLEVREKFSYDKALEARNVFRTEEEAHRRRALYSQALLLADPSAPSRSAHDDFAATA